MLQAALGMAAATGEEEGALTKRDWQRARRDKRRMHSITDEQNREKGDRAARWLDKADLREWEKLERDIDRLKPKGKR